MGNVLLVRHGETALNEPGKERIRAFLNVPLNENGKQQAIQLALRLKDHNISRIYHSSLGRARETAKPISSVTGAPTIEDPRALPWRCGGAIEGQPVKDVLPAIKYYADHDTELPPKGGEAFRAFSDRFISMLKDRLHEARNMTSDTAIVAHSRCLQLARAWNAAGRPSDNSYNKNVMNDYSKELPPSSYMIINEKGLKEV